MAPTATVPPGGPPVPSEEPGEKRFSALARALATGHSALVMRNVSVRGRRTSIRLEPQIWDTLAEICRREYCTLHDVCSYAAEHKPPHASLTSSLRVFVLDYFRRGATEDGHRHAGHGQGMFLAQQQELREMRAMKGRRRGRESLDGLDELKRGP